MLLVLVEISKYQNSIIASSNSLIYSSLQSMSGVDFKIWHIWTDLFVAWRSLKDCVKRKSDFQAWSVLLHSDGMIIQCFPYFSIAPAPFPFTTQKILLSLALPSHHWWINILGRARTFCRNLSSTSGILQLLELPCLDKVPAFCEASSLRTLSFPSDIVQVQHIRQAWLVKF